MFHRPQPIKEISSGTPPILITWQMDNWKPASLDHVRITKSESSALCLLRWLCMDCACGDDSCSQYERCFSTTVDVLKIFDWTRRS